MMWVFWSVYLIGYGYTFKRAQLVSEKSGKNHGWAAHAAVSLLWPILFLIAAVSFVKGSYWKWRSSRK